MVNNIANPIESALRILGVNLKIKLNRSMIGTAIKKKIKRHVTITPRTLITLNTGFAIIKNSVELIIMNINKAINPNINAFMDIAGKNKLDLFDR